jgi:hypothetical protein
MEGIMKKVFIMVVMILSAGSLFAGSMKCETEDGYCEFNEDGSFVCECKGGMSDGGGVAGSPTDDEEFEMPTEEECLEWVEMFCGVPEGAEECTNPAGDCMVYADGSWDCYCQDGRWESSWDNGGGSEPGYNPGDDSTEPYPIEEEDYEVPEKDEPDYDYTCEQNSDCPPNYICEDGFCEFDYENFEPPVCKEVLEDVCGTKAPNINDICTTESFGYCTNVFSVYLDKCEDEEVPQAMIDELEKGGWNELGREIADCCREYEYTKTYLDELLECFETKSCEECFRQFEEELEEDDIGAPVSDDDKGSSGEDQNSDGTMEDDTPKESTKSDSSKGCSVLVI